jgi:poly(ribitol-phosphate) beta-N-acetylglucosaminyltransferase
VSSMVFGDSSPTTAPKVSVVVPVYNPGRHIDGLLASLERQSMSRDDFEVIFVDDGSTDGTGERLDRLAGEAPNMRVIHIPNSGWPGKPRNVGIEAARGEYIQFVDNDDELGDEALERLYAYAVENDSDVVVGKEIHRNGKPGFGSLFRRNRPRATLANDPLLALLTPHKMFRRTLLDEHGIRFPEGPRRLEDHPFVVKAYFRANVISVLADYPCYHWVRRRDGSNAGKRQREWRSFFGYLRDALDVVEEHTEPGDFRNRLLAHWYRTKGLAWLGPGFARRDPDDAYRFLDSLRGLAAERYPAGVDEHLPGILRVRSALLRAGAFDEIRRLAEFERTLDVQQNLEQLEAGDGRLTIRVAAQVHHPDGTPVAFEPVGERLFWPPPIELGPHVPSEALDFTSAYELVRLHVVVRGRSTNEAFVVPGDTALLPPLADGRRIFGATRTAQLDPDTVANGNSLSRQVWDLDIQLDGCGWTHRRRLSSRAGAAPRVPLTAPIGANDRVVPFTTRHGAVALDVDQRLLRPARTPSQAARRPKRRIRVKRLLRRLLPS